MQGLEMRVESRIPGAGNNRLQKTSRRKFQQIASVDANAKEFYEP